MPQRRRHLHTRGLTPTARGLTQGARGVTLFEDRFIEERPAQLELDYLRRRSFRQIVIAHHQNPHRVRVPNTERVDTFHVPERVGPVHQRRDGRLGVRYTKPIGFNGAERRDLKNTKFIWANS